MYKRVLYGDGCERLIPVVHDVDHAVGLFTSKQKLLTPWLRAPSCSFHKRWLAHVRALACSEPSRRGRRFSPELEAAYELARAPYSADTLREQIRLASNYCKLRSRELLLLRDRESGDVLALPYKHRFSPTRIHELKRYFRRIVAPNLARFNRFLLATFTLDHKRFGSQLEAKDYALKRFNRVWTAVKRRCKRWRLKVAMIRTTEWQSNGKGVHLHVLFCGVRFLPVKWLRRLWGEPNPRSVQLKSLGG